MARVALVHWKDEEQPERLQHIDEAGHQAIRTPTEETPILRQLRADPPDAVVISLERMPSSGREAAIRLRKSPKTRHVPLVFLGPPKRAAPLMEMFADGVFIDEWAAVSEGIADALALDPSELLPPGAKPTVPLATKLGIEPGMGVFVSAGPDPLPEGLLGEGRGVDSIDGSGLVVAFVRSSAELDAFFEGADPDGPHVWIAHPKKSSGIAADFTQDDVRRVGLAAGWVDYKVAAIDPTWSGLKFAPK